MGNEFAAAKAEMAEERLMRRLGEAPRLDLRPVKRGWRARLRAFRARLREW